MMFDDDDYLMEQLMIALGVGLFQFGFMYSIYKATGNIMVAEVLTILCLVVVINVVARVKK